MNEPEQMPVHTFVVRLWREWSLVTPQWRGRVLHLPSGETAAFRDWEGLTAFMEVVDLDEGKLTLPGDKR